MIIWTKWALNLIHGVLTAMCMCEYKRTLFLIFFLYKCKFQSSLVLWQGRQVWKKRVKMVLMAWRSSRVLFPASMMIFPNSGSKQAATIFPTWCTSSPIGSHVLPQDVTYLLYEIIIHQITKKIKYKLDGTNFFIYYGVLGPHSKWNHSKIPMLTHNKK